MKKMHSWFSLATIILAVQGDFRSVAAPISAPVAGLILNNTTPDTDLDLLIQFAGLSFETLNFSSTIQRSGYTTTFQGIYAGKSLDVVYTGNLSAYPDGAITWTSTGTYGSDPWAGSGSATFSFLSERAFQLNYESTLMVGANLGADNLIINGTIGPTITYTDASGTTSLNGVTTPIASDFIDMNVPYKPKPGDPDDDNIKRDGQWVLFSTTIIRAVEPAPPDEPELIIDDGTIWAQSIPDHSSTFTLLGVSVFALLELRRRRVS